MTLYVPGSRLSYHVFARTASTPTRRAAPTNAATLGASRRNTRAWSHVLQLESIRSIGHRMGSPARALRVAVVGSGPAAFYAAGHLLDGNDGVQVDMIERL